MRGITPTFLQRRTGATLAQFRSKLRGIEPVVSALVRKCKPSLCSASISLTRLKIKMIKNPYNCKHEWVDTSNANGFVKADALLRDHAHFRCEKCNIEMKSHDVFQLEALENQTKLANHQLGFQKYLSLSAFIVSFIAVLISIFK